ncbi:MAG TPA: hypothetical protein VGC88_07370, partial [Terriglobales bacterium]
VLTALSIGMITTGGGMALDHILHPSHPLFSASDLFEGLVAAIASGVALSGVQRRRRDLMNRVQIVEDVNHHVRNALTAVTYSAVLKDDPALDRVVREANARIDWVLSNVLPKTLDAPEPSEEHEVWSRGLSINGKAKGSAA